MGEIRDWLFTLVSHWQYWASGGGLGGLVVLLANMIERFKAKSMSNTSYILIFIVCFLVGASFMAWRDEHIKVLASEKERPSLAFPSAEIKPIPDQQGNVAELRLNIGFMNDGKQTLVHTRGRMIATDSSLNSPPMINLPTSYANPVAPKERFTFTGPVRVGASTPESFVICLINYDSSITGLGFHQEFYFVWGGSDAQGRFYNQFAGATLEQKALIVQYLGKLGIDTTGF